MCSINTLPPKPIQSSSRTKVNHKNKNVSRLLQLQASFQAKQLEEKEDKLINYLESRNMKNSVSSRENLKSGNSLTSSSSCTSLFSERSQDSKLLTAISRKL